MRPSHDQPRWRQWVTVRTVPVFVLLGIATLLAIQWAMSSPKQPVVRIEGALAQQISRATTIHDCLNLDNGPAAIICAGHAVGAIVKRLKEQFPSPCVPAAPARWAGAARCSVPAVALPLTSLSSCPLLAPRLLAAAACGGSSSPRGATCWRAPPPSTSSTRRRSRRCVIDDDAQAGRATTRLRSKHE